MDKNQIVAELQTDEGAGPPGKPFQLYRDSRGYWTIGYGFCVDPSLNCQIPPPVAAFWLSYLVDRKTAELTARSDWPWFASLSPARQQLLVLLDYNEGLGGILEFHLMLADLAAGDYEGAASNLQDSLWFKQVGVRGPKYVNIMRTGVWE